MQELISVQNTKTQKQIQAQRTVCNSPFATVDALNVASMGTRKPSSLP